MISSKTKPKSTNMFPIIADGACSSVSFIRVNQERWDRRQEHFTLLQLKEADQSFNKWSVFLISLSTLQLSSISSEFCMKLQFCNLCASDCPGPKEP